MQILRLCFRLGDRHSTLKIKIIALQQVCCGIEAVVGGKFHLLLELVTMVLDLGLQVTVHLSVVLANKVH